MRASPRNLATSQKALCPTQSWSHFNKNFPLNHLSVCWIRQEAKLGGRNSHSNEMSVSIWICVALSHVMVKKCFLSLDIFRMPWFEEEVRSTVQKASIGGEVTALHTQNQAVSASKQTKNNYSLLTPTHGFGVERNLLWFKWLGQFFWDFPKFPIKRNPWETNHCIITNMPISLNLLSFWYFGLDCLNLVNYYLLIV